MFIVAYAFLYALALIQLGAYVDALPATLATHFVAGGTPNGYMHKDSFILFYLACAAASGYAFVLSDPGSQSPLIGASGSVSGAIAAYLLLYPRVKVWILVLFRLPLRLRVEWVLGFWILLQLLSAFSGDETDIAWWAHLGGLATGALLILVLRLPGVPLFARALPDDHPLFGRRSPPAPAPVPVPISSLPPPEAGPPPDDNRGLWG